MPEYSGKREIPFLVGRYRCEEYLGGGMSHVYRARDTELPREVVIKILKEENMHDAEARDAFIAEVQLACQCQHDNIVTTFDKGEYDGLPYIVMELLRGEDLQALIKRGDLGGPARALRIAIQIARAMECVHGQGIIHRDLKPANVQFNALGNVKLVDFGIAKRAEWNRTQVGFTKGTAHYMAPEQILGKPATFAMDVWAYGVVLFELLTGERPFQGPVLNELWSAILNQEPDWGLLDRHGVAPAVQAVVRRCLDKDPGQRYQNFGEVIAALESAQAGPAETPRDLPAAASARAVVISPPSPPSSVRRRTAILIGAVAAVLAGGGFAAWKILAPTRPTMLSMPETGDMVFVPAGRALLGPDRNPVEVPAFYIDRTEVSNRAYSNFIKATQHRQPGKFPEDRPNDPVVNVSLEDARAFARWAGKRLPSGIEWEKAARGTDGRKFPWGDIADAKLANVHDNPGGTPGVMPVNSFAATPNPFGAINMAGNVWEWVEKQITPEKEVLAQMQRDLKPALRTDEIFYALRGSSFGAELAAVNEEAPFPKDRGDHTIGFRCAKTP